MILDVALVPAEARRWENAVCIVVDVLRASSTIVTLFDRGCEAVLPVRSLAEARRLKKAHGYPLAGERGGLPPAGFDYGNSPAEFATLDLTGQRVILTTGNGTAVLVQVAAAAAVIVGCFRNATACCRRGLELAACRAADLGIVCAGTHRRFVLDDAVCAGALAETALLLARATGQDMVPTDAARAAMRLWQSYSGDIEQAFRDSASGRWVNRINHAADLAFCAVVDATQVVPLLTPGSSLVLHL